MDKWTEGLTKHAGIYSRHKNPLDSASRGVIISISEKYSKYIN